MSDGRREQDVSSASGSTGWYLETIAEMGRLQRIPIHTLPFRVGRRPGIELVLPADSVSKNHAEIYAADSGLGACTKLR